MYSRVHMYLHMYIHTYLPQLVVSSHFRPSQTLLLASVNHKKSANKTIPVCIYMWTILANTQQSGTIYYTYSSRGKRPYIIPSDSAGIFCFTCTHHTPCIRPGLIGGTARCSSGEYTYYTRVNGLVTGYLC